MNITKNVISDLFPLYAENECTTDTRALVEDYLQRHPKEAAEFKSVLQSSLPRSVSSDAKNDEVVALRKARRKVRLQSWILAFAIFFSLTPFSVLHTGGKTYWLLIEAPMAALTYGAAGAACWVSYAIMRSRARAL